MRKIMAEFFTDYGKTSIDIEKIISIGESGNEPDKAVICTGVYNCKVNMSYEDVKNAISSLHGNINTVTVGSRNVR